MKIEQVINRAERAIPLLRDPSTAKVYAGASDEWGAGWYDIGIVDETGDVVCISSAHTDIGSHAEADAKQVAKALKMEVLKGRPE